ncbi:MAG: adenylate/guanylate cyclase domain-containing protein [Leptospiraceae bacterium]|nr:adenylate/guanylate cyclase domain-containing protein [Leptospiraceae bacterium]
MRVIINLFRIFVILFLVFCNSKGSFAESSSIAEAGEIDLRNWDFQSKGFIRLDGNWRFYWNEFKAPEELMLIVSSKNFQSIKVPGSWNDHLIGEKKVGGNGFATYGLVIQVSPSLIGKILTLKIPHMGTAYKFFVDNDLLAKNGVIGKTKEEMKPQYLSLTRSFIVKSEFIYFTVHVSNFHHRKGGMRFDSIFLGTESDLQSLQSMNTIYIFFLMGSLVIMIIYHLGLFFLRREDTAALVFGMFCFFIAARLFFVGDVWITTIFPKINWSWMYRFEYLSLYLSAPTFSLFTYSVFNKEYHKKVLYFLLPVYGILCFVVLFTQPSIFSLSLNFFQILAVINTIYIVYVIIRAVTNKKEGAIAALIGFVFFVLTIANDLLYNNEIYVTGYGNLLPFGVFLFIFSQSFILSQIFANAFKSVKILSNSLSLTNEAYSRFVPVEFLKYLNKKSIIDIQLGDQMQREMAVLFSDIRSFTDLSERLTPKENFNFLNSYLKRVSPVIQKNNGFIDKYIGDSIMALFPGRVEDAINAGIEMQKEIRVYNQHRLKSGYDPIKVGCGIHTGNLMLGIIGADQRMEGTVIADSVNVASRIEGLTKVYDVSILISDIILKKIETSAIYNYRFIDKVKVKGKTEHTIIYEIYDGQPDFMIEMKNQSKVFFEAGINYYYEKKFKEARIEFERVIEINPNDTASRIYLKRVTYYIENGIVEFLE